MDNARLKVDVNGTEYEVDIGFIQSTRTKYSPSVAKFGIPAVPSQNTFVTDKGVSKTISQDYVRVAKSKDPANEGGADSTLWSNGYWIKFVKKYLVNRWQTGTDGCTYSFSTPLDYPDTTDTNVYIASFTHTLTVGAITGNIQVKVGSHRKPKAVAQHIIIYYINIENNKTNMLYVTDNTSTTLKAVPPSWVSSNMEFQGWGTSPSQTSGLLEVGSTLELSDRETELYAIWRVIS